MTTRTWTNGSGLALNATDLNGMEADITSAQNTANSHASRHAAGGADPVSPSSIGAASAAHTHAASDIVSGTLGTGQLGTGSADGTKVLYGDGTWKAPPGLGIGTVTTGAANATITGSNPQLLNLTLPTGTDFGYLVANFGNNVTPDFEKLNVHYSPDGHYVAAGVNNPVYTPASTTSAGGLRDPSIVKFNGRWYCAHGINNGANFTFEIAVSDDLVNWSLNTTVTVTTAQIPNLLYVWAPELVQDRDGTWVVLFTAVLSTSGNPHDIYWVRSSDSTLSTWTAPTKIVWSGASNGGAPIDPTAIYTNNQWYIFYGNNGSIQRATCATLTGTWNTDQTGNWAGWYTDSPANSTIHYEGPEILQVSSNLWRIYFDQYTGATAPYTTVGYWWSETSDPTLTTGWSAPKQAVRSPGYPDGYALRHGTWLKLGSAADQELVMSATSAGGPRQIHHVEYTGSGTTTAGQPWSGTLAKDTNKSSAQAPNFSSVSGRVVKILQNGLYSVHFVAPYDKVLALGGGYMSIKGPSGNPVYASTDIVSSAAAQSISVPNLWLINGDTLEFFIAPTNAMGSTFNLRIRLTKIA